MSTKKRRKYSQEFKREAVVYIFSETGQIGPTVRGRFQGFVLAVLCTFIFQVSEIRFTTPSEIIKTKRRLEGDFRGRNFKRFG